jgi:hypothetical protein
VIKLSGNEKLRQEMGAAAKRFVKKNFEAEDIFKEIERVIS